MLKDFTQVIHLKVEFYEDINCVQYRGVRLA